MYSPLKLNLWLLNLPLQKIEEEALKLNIMPKRYMWNSKTISPSEQLRLLKSTVAVVGCGGLGGYAIEIGKDFGVYRMLLKSVSKRSSMPVIV